MSLVYHIFSAELYWVTVTTWVACEEVEPPKKADGGEWEVVQMHRAGRRRDVASYRPLTPFRKSIRPSPSLPPPCSSLAQLFFVIFLVFFVTVVIVVRSGSGFGQLSMEVKRSLLGRDRVLFCPTRCVDLECGIQFSCVAINATFISYSCISWAATLPFLLESQVHALFSRRPYLKQFLYKISKPSQLKILSRKYLKKWK